MPSEYFANILNLDDSQNLIVLFNIVYENAFEIHVKSIFVKKYFVTKYHTVGGRLWVGGRSRWRTGGEGENRSNFIPRLVLRDLCADFDGTGCVGQLWLSSREKKNIFDGFF